MGDTARVKAALVMELHDAGDVMCPLCGYRLAVTMHHIIPRSRTSAKHPAWWRDDKRNLLLICAICDTDMLHTKEGIRKCLKIQRRKHPEWDYSVEPWGAYRGDDEL